MIPYVILSIALIIWSYTQVDLNLTINRWEPYLTLQKYLTIIGYYKREINMYLLIGLLIAMVGLYALSILQSTYNKITYKALFARVIMVGLLLSFSYTAFSHDLFNYMFDARILTFYSQNPYQHKALDYPHDPWTRFMQWTHRNYPYGPIWLGITVIPSYFGGGKFLPTFLLFKMLFAIVYIGCAFIIGKIAEQHGENKRLAIALFAFHPLILIDGLISPHIDLGMLFFALLSIYLMGEQKKVKAVISILLSAGIKFATIIIVPCIVITNKITEKQRMIAIWTAVCLGVVAQIVYSGHLQSWYWIMFVGMTPVMYKFFGIKKTILLLSIPLPMLYIYLYFIRTGTWP